VRQIVDFDSTRSKGASSMLCASGFSAGRKQEMTNQTTVLSDDTFLNSIGVNTHMGFLNTSYNDEGKVIQSLNYLGIDHVREYIPYSWGVSHWDKLADANIKFDFVIPDYNGVDLTGSMAILDAFVQNHPGSVLSVEGANEVLNRPVSYLGELLSPMRSNFSTTSTTRFIATPTSPGFQFTI
jgi:hypothetical protein